MTATTYTNFPGTSRGPKTGGWFSGFLNRLIEARTARVRREVSAHLRGFNDQTLTELGFSADEIRRLRHGEYVGFPA